MTGPADPRRALRDLRRALPAAHRIAAAVAVAQRVLPMLPAGDIAGYWAVDGELPLNLVQSRLPADARWCLPVLHAPDRTLRFARWSPGAPLAPNRYGIPEPDVDAASLLPPQALACVLMPMAGFDARGHRLGMGGGWYDRSFAFRRQAGAPPLLVGIAFDEQELPQVDAQPWDILPDLICTPTRLLHRP